MDPIAIGDTTTGQTVEPQVVIQYYARLHPATAVWGRDLRSLQEMDGLSGVALLVNEGPAPYVLYEPGDEGSVTIIDIAAARVEQGVALLAHLQRTQRHIVCNNEPDGSPMLDAFAAAGFRKHASRFDMRMDL